MVHWVKMPIRICDCRNIIMTLMDLLMLAWRNHKIAKQVLPIAGILIQAWNAVQKKKKFRHEMKNVEYHHKAKWLWILGRKMFILWRIVHLKMNSYLWLILNMNLVGFLRLYSVSILSSSFHCCIRHFKIDLYNV